MVYLINIINASIATAVVHFCLLALLTSLIYISLRHVHLDSHPLAFRLLAFIFLSLLVIIQLHFHLILFPSLLAWIGTPAFTIACCAVSLYVAVYEVDHTLFDLLLFTPAA